MGLNRLFDANLSTEELCEIGIEIGADIPFCIVGGTQFCQGIGEVLTPLSPLPDCTILLCKPPLNVSTGEAYRAIDSGEISRRPDNPVLLDALKNQNLPAAGKTLCNVFTSALPLAEVNAIETEMKAHGALGACMSGSGSAVFGLFEAEDDAQRCAASLRIQYDEVFLARPRPTGVEPF